MKTISVIALLVAVACTKPENRCTTDSDCTNPAYPFCDADGQYAPSDGEKGVCTIVPPDCPVDRCGCTAGATTCTMNVLSVCNSDGASQTMTNCDVGCESDGTACKTFVPSNGLAPSFSGASALPALVIPDGANIDTDTGVVSSSDGTVVHDGSVSSLVTFGSLTIRVFAAPTLALHSIKVNGTLPIAFVAATTIDVDGLVDVSADGSNAGPGAAGSDSLSTAAPFEGTSCNICSLYGAGGGGDAIAGGAGGGGSNGGTGAVAETGFLLVGGGGGGSGLVPVLGHPDSVNPGGGGGGAIQLVAGTQLTLAGIINAGGGGGTSIMAGGGAGGVVILESPVVSIGAVGGIAANGGGGAGCFENGGDGTPDAVAAAGGSDSGLSPSMYGGTGGVVSSTIATEAGGEGLPPSGQGSYGGGGGSVGRARIATFDGTFTQDPSAIMSVVVTADTLQTQ
jgi:hypothetical protein